jgi:hypothetical protein
MGQGDVGQVHQRPAVDERGDVFEGGGGGVAAGGVGLPRVDRLGAQVAGDAGTVGGVGLGLGDDLGPELPVAPV